MVKNSNGTFTSSRFRLLLCLVFLIAAGIAVLGAITSSCAFGQGGSASPLGAVASAKAAGDDGKTIAERANIRRLSRVVGQRVEESPRRPFHLKIAPWVIEHTAHDQQAEFFVVLADQADLSGATALATKGEKGRYVHEALWTKSQATQRPILQWLRERGIEHRSFYIVNAILVKGSREIEL